MSTFVLARPESSPEGAWYINMDHVDTFVYQPRADYVKDTKSGQLTAVAKDVLPSFKSDIEAGLLQLVKGPWLCLVYQDGQSVEFTMEAATFFHNQLKFLADPSVIAMTWPPSR